MRYRTVRSVLLVLALCIGIIVITVILFVWQHRQSASTSAERVNAEFGQLRARFSGQQPLLDLNTQQLLVNSVTTQSVTGQAVKPIHSFHTVIFDTRGIRIVHITVPYWFARLFAGRSGNFRWLGQLTFLDDTEFDPDPIQLSLEQIVQHGPGLIVDWHHASGGQFIAWVE